jgi:hypothetical protein
MHVSCMYVERRSLMLSFPPSLPPSLSPSLPPSLPPSAKTRGAQGDEHPEQRNIVCSKDGV